MLEQWYEPYYKLGKIEIIDDGVSLYAVFNKWYQIVETGSIDDCITFLDSQGIDTSKYQEMVKKGELK